MRRVVLMRDIEQVVMRDVGQGWEGRIQNDQQDVLRNPVSEAEWLTKPAIAALLAFTLAYFIIHLLLASRKLMWDDEFFTLYISRTGSYAEIVRALMTGADQHPPFFYWVTHLSFALFGINHIALRLPAIVGMWVMSVFVFCFVARRLPWHF